MSAPQTGATGHSQAWRNKHSLSLLPFLLSRLSCHHPYPQFLLTYNNYFLQSSAKPGVSWPLLRSGCCLPASFGCLSVSPRSSRGTSSLPASPFSEWSSRGRIPRGQLCKSFKWDGVWSNQRTQSQRVWQEHHALARDEAREAGRAGSLGGGWRRNNKEGRPNGTASSWSCTLLMGQ